MVVQRSGENSSLLKGPGFWAFFGAASALIVSGVYLTGLALAGILLVAEVILQAANRIEDRGAT